MGFEALVSNPQHDIEEALTQLKERMTSFVRCIPSLREHFAETAADAHLVVSLAPNRHRDG